MGVMTGLPEAVGCRWLWLFKIGILIVMEVDEMVLGFWIGCRLEFGKEVMQVDVDSGETRQRRRMCLVLDVKVCSEIFGCSVLIIVR